MGGAVPSTLVYRFISDDGNDTAVDLHTVDAIAVSDLDVRIYVDTDAFAFRCASAQEVDKLLGQWTATHEYTYKVVNVTACGNKSYLAVLLRRVRAILRKDTTTTVVLHCGAIVEANVTDEEHTALAQTWLNDIQTRSAVSFLKGVK